MFDFGTHLKEIRQFNCKTQKQVADAIGVGERNYQSFEYGKVKPSFDNIVKLCEYFNVSSDYLLGLSDEPTRR